MTDSKRCFETINLKEQSRRNRVTGPELKTYIGEHLEDERTEVFGSISPCPVWVHGFLFSALGINIQLILYKVVMKSRGGGGRIDYDPHIEYDLREQEHRKNCEN